MCVYTHNFACIHHVRIHALVHVYTHNIWWSWSLFFMHASLTGARRLAPCTNNKTILGAQFVCQIGMHACIIGISSWYVCVYTHNFACIHDAHIHVLTCVYTHMSRQVRETPIRVVRPALICSSDKLLEKHIKYWIDRMPDISDKPQMPPSELQFWLKQKRKSRLKPHAALPGLCGSRLNEAIDFAIAKNKWPQRFKDLTGSVVNMVPGFTVTAWVKYVSRMVCHTACADTYTHACIHT